MNNNEGVMIFLIVILLASTIVLSYDKYHSSKSDTLFTCDRYIGYSQCTYTQNKSFFVNKTGSYCDGIIVCENEVEK